MVFINFEIIQIMDANQIIQTPLDQVPDNDICSLHGKPITKLCTHDNMFLCQSCCELDQHREHMFKSISFLAEEISESLRVKLSPNERTLDQFSHILRDLQEKFKKSNIRSQLSLIVEMIKGIVKQQMEKSQVIEDCGVLLEAFRGKVEKVGQMKKRVKQGDRACIEVLQQRKEMEEIIQSLGQERMLIESTMDELLKLSYSDLNLELIRPDLQDTAQQDILKKRLHNSLIDLIREKNPSLATLVVPEGMQRYFKEQAQQIATNKKRDGSIMLQSSGQKGESAVSEGFESPGKKGVIGKTKTQESEEKKEDPVDQHQIIQATLTVAHQEFINCLSSVSPALFATGGSDFRINLWNKKSISLFHSFEVPGEVASITASGNTIICGLINGTLALLDIEKKCIVNVIDRAHTGTVVACATINEMIVSQDDSREIRIWSIESLVNKQNEPLAKLIGRSYNPVWFSQSLCPLKFADRGSVEFLSAQGAETKIIHYQFNKETKALQPLQTSFTAGIPAALAQLNDVYYTCATVDQLQFFDIASGMCVHTSQLSPFSLDAPYSSFAEHSQESLLTLTVAPAPSDPLKRHLFCAGSGRAIYWYVVDLQLKCAAMALCKVMTGHDNTISGVIMAGEGSLVTVGIDKQMATYTVRGKEKQGKTNMKQMQWKDKGAISDQGSKILSDYMKEREQLNSRGGSNASCACNIF
ncbi:hypothetical protein FGO68_gene14879 [Halteria grandinella]|uniref:B box-type domain-containing protein n=1 Tax=Halteria grandinella TaxID=5974 RepID=A0A8J8NVI8_HALGN|nr:hypothetical protein FGO68_gene14879 [Halteria grandinella]